MKSLYLFFAFVLCMFGCDEGMEIVDDLDSILTEPVLDRQPPEQSPAGEVGKSLDDAPVEAPTGLHKASIKFHDRYDSEILKYGIVGHTSPLGGGFYDYGSITKSGWDTSENIAIGRPDVMMIHILILDPERRCLSRNEVEPKPDFVKPYEIAIFNWDTGEPFRFHMPRWEGQPPEPIIRKFFNVPTNKDICPRKWFYYGRLPIYLKYVDGYDSNSLSRVPVITAEEIGITIEFENGDKLTWQLSEIGYEIPPMPPFRLFRDNEL